MLYGEFCMLDYIKEYINNNFKSIVLIFSCLIIGLVVGIITFNFMPGGTKTEIIQTLNNTLSSTKSENFEGINVIKYDIEWYFSFNTIFFINNINCTWACMYDKYI